MQGSVVLSIRAPSHLTLLIVSRLYRGNYKEIIKALGGTTVVLAALFGFTGKVRLARMIETYKVNIQQKLLEVRAEVDDSSKKLNAELQSATYISQMQLEHEYKI